MNSRFRRASRAARCRRSPPRRTGGPRDRRARVRRNRCTPRQGARRPGSWEDWHAGLALASRSLPVSARYSSSTETTFESEPDAPAASVTVAVIVKLRGRRITYVWLTVKLPWVVLVPVLTVPSPQAIRYDHGPLPFASLKLKLVE